jgi:hypothetical protein
MYEVPKLERYGTFRELTRGGGITVDDMQTENNPNDDCISSVPDPTRPGGTIDTCTGS